MKLKDYIFVFTIFAILIWGAFIQYIWIFLIILIVVYYLVSIQKNFGFSKEKTGFSNEQTELTCPRCLIPVDEESNICPQCGEEV